MTACKPVVYSDLTVCETCKLRWDTNDTNPPACPYPARDGLPLTGLATGTGTQVAGLALAWLRVLSFQAVPAAVVDPSAASALKTAAAVADTQIASPFRAQRGRLVPALTITPHGRRILTAAD